MESGKSIDRDPTQTLLICGAREWTDSKKISDELRAWHVKSTIVIHGGCPGVDSMAGKLAEGMGFKVKVFPAEWKKYGRAAGPIRNQQMIDEGKPDFCLAFHPCIKEAKGTKDMVNKCLKHKVPYKIIP